MTTMQRAAAAGGCALALALVAGMLAMAGAADGDAPRSPVRQAVPPAVAPADTTFAEPVRYPVAGPKRASPPNGIVVADLNGDKVPDLAAGLDGTPNVSVMLGDGKGGYRPRTLVAVRFQTHQISADDMDGDGDLDLVVPQHESVLAVLTNDGRARFKPRYYTINKDTDGFDSVEEPDIDIADVDRDGRLDVIASAGVVRVLPGTAAGLGPSVRWVSPKLPPQNAYLRALAIADLTGDGAPEIVRAVTREGAVLIARNDGRGGFPTSYAVDAEVDKPPPLTLEKESCSGDVCSGGGYRGVAVRATAAAADVDDDGAADLVVAHSYTPGLTIVPGDGLGGFGAPRRVARGLADVDRLVVADLNADGVGDFVTTLLDEHTVAIVLSGLGGYAEPVRFDVVPGKSWDLLAADVDGDLDNDIVVGDISRVRVVVLRNKTV